MGGFADAEPLPEFDWAADADAGARPDILMTHTHTTDGVFEEKG